MQPSFEVHMPHVEHVMSKRPEAAIAQPGLGLIGEKARGEKKESGSNASA